ncbi:VOC family protein [Streptomyces triticirhizae]|uniref:VOC family protein n=1 Tax=Streptomyces triticirhizae TaxID=2483353 RepID=UPI001F2FC387|nr:VOC family protein [Streptomyces triticirhizae]
MSLRTGHVGLNVTDLDRSLPFYTEVFQLDVAQKGQDGDRRWAFLTRDGALLITLWQQSARGFATDRSGLHHLSFQAESMEEVREREAVLRGLGVEFAYDGVVPHGEGAASGGIFFRDPDGIRLEIFAATGAEAAPAPVAAAPTCGFF